MFVQIDADMITYQIGHSMDSKGLHQGLMKSIVKKKVDSLLDVAKKVGKVTDLVFYLTSNDKSNFRFEIDSQYKANRKVIKKPKYYHEIREFFQDFYSAELVDGMEADDTMSINAWKHYKSGKKGDLCLTISGDKDLRIAPGLHYEMNDSPIYEVHWPGYLSIFRRTKTTNVFGTGLVWFYYQLIAGDKVDNVQRVGLSQVECYHKLNSTLDDYYSTLENRLFKTVECLYVDNGLTLEHLINNARLLWLKTDENEPLWEPPCGG